MDLQRCWTALEPIAQRYRGRSLAFQAIPELHRRRIALQAFVAQRNILGPTPNEVPLPASPQPPPTVLKPPPNGFLWLSNLSEEKQKERLNMTVFNIAMAMQSTEYWFVMAEGKGRDVAQSSTFLPLTKSELMVEVRQWADEVEGIIAAELGRALTKEEKVTLWTNEGTFWLDESQMWENYVKEVHLYSDADEVPPRHNRHGQELRRDYFNLRLARRDGGHK